MGQLRDFIENHGGFDKSKMKILHKGKILNQDDAHPLSDCGFKENEKIIVMGGRKVVKDDPGFSSLVAYENKHLGLLRKTLDDIEKDIGELEKNYLEESKQREMAKRVEKRVKIFSEDALRHLENIDGLVIVTDDTDPQQAQRNREKRKSLINGIQLLLNANDALSRRLEEYFMKLDGKVVE
ncbi:unnamed protein product [Caenorhabditis auriculariae]|uniref:BAG family molecular chaperone regulator 1 n=1 Tax=Caenorhabditis auriculariae TaxID=2777116 RepID=A0A8S1GMB6_9PELO|nr:unnamed protein product [Caenorhabditis auriculariae]